MFEARTVEPARLRVALDAVRDCAADVTLTVSPEGVFTEAIDSASAVLVTLFLGEEDFEHFRCDSPMQLRVSLADVARVLRAMGGAASVTLASRDGRSLVVCAEHGDGDAPSVSEYELRAGPGESPGIGADGHVDYKVTLGVGGERLTLIMQSVSTVADDFSLSVGGSSAAFSASGPVGDVRVRLAHKVLASQPNETVEVEAAEECSGKFAVKYLAPLGRARSLAPRVTLALSEGAPLRAELRFGKAGKLTYYVAPRL